MKTAATLLLACTLLLVPSGALVAQQVCPCVPLTHEWIVEPCNSWNCAAAATILANGDKYVIALPTNSDDFKWLILRRIVSGSAIIPADAPFRVAAFDGASEAMARYGSVGEEFTPMMLTAPDGKFLVLSRSTAAPRRRAATH
jgi:hypothetical protein